MNFFFFLRYIGYTDPDCIINPWIHGEEHSTEQNKISRDCNNFKILFYPLTVSSSNDRYRTRGGYGFSFTLYKSFLFEKKLQKMVSDLAVSLQKCLEVKGQKEYSIPLNHAVVWRQINFPLSST